MSDASSANVLVVAAVIVACGRVLVTQRLEGAQHAGKWEFPGGKVEPNENPRIALQRELREELGIDTDAGEVLDVGFLRYPSGSVVVLFFETAVLQTSPQPKALGVADIAWCTSEELRGKDFAPVDAMFLDRAIACIAHSEAAR